MKDDTISRQAAVKALEETKQSDPFNRYEYQNIGIDWSIDAIKALPSAQPSATDTNVGGNLIDRQAVLDALIFDVRAGRQNGKTLMVRYAEEVIKRIKELPSAQPERKNGRWEMKPDPFGFFGEIPVCSECGCTTKMRDKTKFCPHCGAQMEGQ